MQVGQPSRTALAAATHRAAHQVLEQGRIFNDPLALRILGQDAETVAREAQEHPARTRMRLFIAVRTRFAEDALAAAVGRGVRQLVVLGAGLDTYAYRGPFRDRLRIFEVDHPATQIWKRQQLDAASISRPESLTFAPIGLNVRRSPEALLQLALIRCNEPSSSGWASCPTSRVRRCGQRSDLLRAFRMAPRLCSTTVTRLMRCPPNRVGPTTYVPSWWNRSGNLGCVTSNQRNCALD